MTRSAAEIASLTEPTARRASATSAAPSPFTSVVTLAEASSIDFIVAALGGELEVPTLAGRVMLKIPTETQTGKMFRMRGKGVRSVRGGGVGDLICRVVVETPINLNKTQKDALREFGGSLAGAGRKHSPRAESWLDGVKKFFEDMKFS